MKRNIRTAYGLAGFFALGASASAQQPAAELLPVRVLDSAPSIVRGATPYAPFAAIPQAPPDSAPAPKFASANPANGQQKSWASRQWNSAVDTVVGKPSDPTNKPYAPFAPVTGQPPAAPPTGKAVPQRTTPPNTPVQLASAQAPVQPPQGVYAGPPAYRWYGWGSTTPGANPHSPTGVYPKASANWYTQTGATPGAFPIPVTYPRRENGAEPPVYVGGPNPSMIEPSGRIVIAELPKSQPPVPYPEYPTQTQMPAIPSGAPTPIAANYPPPMQVPAPMPASPAPAHAEMPPAPAPTPAPATTVSAANELNWQAAPKPIAAPVLAPVPAPAPVPIPPAAVIAPPAPAPVPPPPPMIDLPAPVVMPASPAPIAPATPTIAPPAEQEQAWKKPKNDTGSAIVHASHKEVVRGQQPTEPAVTLESSIRSICPKNIHRIEINRVGDNGLVVRFVVDAEAHAQEAATVIADLPGIKGFDVRYEALLLAK